jgi:hypothetical protein
MFYFRLPIARLGTYTVNSALSLGQRQQSSGYLVTNRDTSYIVYTDSVDVEWGNVGRDYVL